MKISPAMKPNSPIIGDIEPDGVTTGNWHQMERNEQLFQYSSRATIMQGHLPGQRASGTRRTNAGKLNRHDNATYVMAVLVLSGGTIAR
jgi:hypothetical protein